MPKVTHCTDDQDWGKPGSAKKVFVAHSFTQKGGFGSVDRVIERVENDYWKIEVNEFQTWMLGFYKFAGEWKTKELEANRIQVDYCYTLFANTLLLYPFQWLFAKIFWRMYMERVLENIRKMIDSDMPYLYE